LLPIRDPIQPLIDGDRIIFTPCAQEILRFGRHSRPMPDQFERLRVLVVDDEPAIVDVVSMALRHEGYDVVSAGTGTDAMAEVRDWRPHAIVLDIMLPDMDGFEVARRLGAQEAGVPILFLSARDNTSDKIRGLTTGGDDYVTKPFSLDELLGRIRAVLKRTRPDAPGSRLRVADLELDEDGHEVRRDGAIVALTPTEFRLLRFLMVNAGRVVSKAQILDHVWGHDDQDRDGNVVEPAVSYLRRKVDQGQPRLIHTVRGLGYVLRIPPP
jgi:two-component system OmpR family response regulator